MIILIINDSNNNNNNNVNYNVVHQAVCTYTEVSFAAVFIICCHGSKQIEFYISKMAEVLNHVLLTIKRLRSLPLPSESLTYLPGHKMFP